MTIEELKLKRENIAKELEELKRTSTDYAKIKFLQRERSKCTNYMAQIRLQLKRKNNVK